MTRIPDCSELKRKLLAIEGKRVVVRDHEPHLDLLLSRGSVLSVDRVRKVRGEPNSCHQYAALYYVNHAPKVELATGYFLDDDCWIQHSWCYQDTGRLKTIYDPTAVFQKYFGVILDDDQALRFVFSNLLPHLPGWACMMGQLTAAGSETPTRRP